MEHYATSSMIFLSKTGNFATCRNIVYILPHLCHYGTAVAKVYQVVEEALMIV
jgi:hypothetical protein